MADFGEICPLFSTGVFNEVVFPNIKMTAITASGNALLGLLTCASATRPECWTFGRTVVVTGAYLRIRNTAAIDATTVVRLMHHTTMLAAGTEFATCYSPTALNGSIETATWRAFNTFTNTTFTSSEVLGITMLTGTASGGGTYDVMVRYKEK